MRIRSRAQLFLTAALQFDDLRVRMPVPVERAVAQRRIDLGDVVVVPDVHRKGEQAEGHAVVTVRVAQHFCDALHPVENVEAAAGPAAPLFRPATCP